MEKIMVKADKRPETGKGVARSLRRQGMLPAVVYGMSDATPIQVQGPQMTKIIMSGEGENTLITIELSGDSKKTSEHSVLVKDYQMDPVTDELLHIDFIEVSLEKNVKVTVPLVIVKDPIGVKMGGIMEHRLREVEVECLPTHIPDRIDVDAGFVELGHSLHVSDISVPEKVQILSDAAEVILTVSAPKVEEEVPAEEVEEAAAEPELVKTKGKEEAEEKSAEEKEK
jgi:large subunit ribosomal protein L25